MLDAIVDLNGRNFFTATFTGLTSSNELSFYFNPDRKWEYKSYFSHRDDYLFTVYYVVNGKIRGIAESSVFYLVVAEKCPRYSLEFQTTKSGLTKLSVNELSNPKMMVKSQNFPTLIMNLLHLKYAPKLCTHSTIKNDLFILCCEIDDVDEGI